MFRLVHPSMIWLDAQVAHWESDSQSFELKLGCTTDSQTGFRNQHHRRFSSKMRCRPRLDLKEKKLCLGATDDEEQRCCQDASQHRKAFHGKHMDHESVVPAVRQLPPS